ncbi:MAG: P-loop NTPase fold protein, partial [Geminicoccaceae bacterium]
MRYSDHPITRPAEDRLERSDFARTLATAISKLTIADEGFVMAVTGEWGSGKSSVVSLILHYLRHMEMAHASCKHLYSGDPGIEVDLGDLDNMAHHFERVKGTASQCENENLDPTMSKAAYY